MYTQCSKCETVFKLSAEVLRAAGGQVRCGRCGEVFNALARLAEDSNAFSADESPLDMETRADSILETVVARQVGQSAAKDYEAFVPPGVEIAQLEVLDTDDTDIGDADIGGDIGGADIDDPNSDRSMEFTLPPGELDRIFIESKKRVRLVPVPQPAPPEAHVEAERDPEPEPKPPPDLESALSNSGGRPGAQRRLILWLGAAIAAALLLISQAVHHNRDWFAHAHGPVGAGVRALYGAMGAPLPQPANLSAYQLRQWGVTGDPDANGILKVRASILNTAAQLQPYPLLRVTLADRFGKGIGTRDFEPGEYLGKPIARLLAPGERVDATLEILDPGQNAEGFEIDVCLRGVDRRISCANDVAAQTKR